MRYLKLTTLLACGAALVVGVVGCSDAMAPPFEPDPEALFQISFDDPTCAMTPVAWQFSNIPVVPNADFVWLPAGHGNVSDSYQVLEEPGLGHQDADGQGAVGRAYVGQQGGSNWTVQLNMPLKGHMDVLHLHATVSMRPNQNSMALNHDFSVSTTRTRGIFEATAAINQLVRVTGSIDRPTLSNAKASWTINAEIYTCGVPTQGPNDWFKVLECTGMVCPFWNTPMLGRDSRANKIDTWQWDFIRLDDGKHVGVSNVQRAVFNFESSGNGTYEVRQTVTDTDGYTNPVVQPMYVICENGKCADSGVKRPLAEFTYECDGLTCYFTDTSDPYGDPITSWSWNFGDGAGTSDLRHPSYTFQKADRYRVSLTVADAKGISNTTSRDVIATDPGGGDPDPDPKGPSASYTFDCNQLLCTFTDTSTEGDGGIVAWNWDFGDGNAAAGETVQHTFGEASTYTVTLTVTDDNDLEDIATREVSVEADDPGPDPEPGDLVIDLFDLTNTSNSQFARVRVDWAVSGEDLSTVTVAITGPNSDSRTWSVSGSSASGEHQFSFRRGFGSYTVTLTVYGASGSISDTKQITL